MLPPVTLYGSIRYPNGSTAKYIKYHQGSSGRNSPRINGRLVLRGNPYNMERRAVNFAYASGGESYRRKPVFYPPEAEGLLATQSIWQPISDSCYSSFRRKVYNGGSSLGVSLGGWRQSAQMIRNASSNIVESAADLMRYYRNRGGFRVGKKLADKHLEVIFGWQPLFEDIANAARVMVDPLPNSFVSVSKIARQSYRSSYGPDMLGFSEQSSYDGYCRVNHSAMVEVTNPNLWLAEKLGLLNAASVAWDLVPWSFVVNMFSTVGQVVNSITDYTGLTFHNSYRTVTMKGTWNYRTTDDPLDRPKWKGSNGCASAFSWKTRSESGPPMPSLTLRVPGVDWSTAAMATSLAVQQATRAVRILERKGLWRGAYTE